jgi:hypothetical protein
MLRHAVSVPLAPEKGLSLMGKVSKGRCSVSVRGALSALAGAFERTVFEWYLCCDLRRCGGGRGAGFGF